MDSWAALTIAAIFIFTAAVFWWKRPQRGMTNVTAFNGKQYLVRDLPNSKEVADTLGHLEEAIDSFVQYLAASKYRHDRRVQNIVTRWTGTLAETAVIYDYEAAYSTNKREISVCVRNKAGQIEHDRETAVFILIHELAHLASDEYGHTPEFWNNFRFLLKVAIEDAKIYRYQRFEDLPVEYCGHRISRSPYTCYKEGACPL